MPNKARLTVEIETDKDGSHDYVEIFLNPEAIKLLIRELSALSEENDHFHCTPEDWEDPEVPLSIVPYVSGNTTAKHVKVMYRNDEWDKEHFPHVLVEVDKE